MLSRDDRESHATASVGGSHHPQLRSDTPARALFREGRREEGVVRPFTHRTRENIQLAPGYGQGVEGRLLAVGVLKPACTGTPP